jgi:hypothetical protein
MFTNVKNGKVVDVQGGRDEEGRAVQVYKKNGSAAQKWTIIYEDKKGRTKTRGMNEKANIEINRPFYLRSRMPMQRVVECWGANNIILSDFIKDRRGQQFFFDEKSKTIKSQQWQDRSINIQGNGRSGNVNMQGTTSRWW